MTIDAMNDPSYGCACGDMPDESWKPNGFCDDCGTRWKPVEVPREMPAYGGGMSNPPLAGIWAHVVEDMKKRDAFGYSKYGKHLEPHDGRDSLKDAYEEALDLAVYLRKAIYERDGK